ncbi:MAG: hypothetical protein PSY14_00320 [bacterium]|nr:hypothetical protein [bacterium]
MKNMSRDNLKSQHRYLQYRVQTLFVVFVMLLSTSHIAHADLEGVEQPPRGDYCERLQRKAASVEFRDLDHVELYVHLPTRVKKFLECHGQEEKCASQYSNSDKYKQQLIEDYLTFPTALHTDNLTALMSSKIETSILPYVLKTKECSVKPLTILDRTQALTNAPGKGRLRIVLTLSIDDLNDKYAPIQNVALSIQLYRSDPAYTNFNTQVLRTLTMPINLSSSDEDINRRVDYVISRRSLGVRPEGSIMR